jgi:hypothetical protein
LGSPCQEEYRRLLRLFLIISHRKAFTDKIQTMELPQLELGSGLEILLSESSPKVKGLYLMEYAQGLELGVTSLMGAMGINHGYGDLLLTALWR